MGISGCGLFILVNTPSVSHVFVLQHNFRRHSQVRNQETEGVEGPVNQVRRSLVDLGLCFL